MRICSLAILMVFTSVHSAMAAPFTLQFIGHVTAMDAGTLDFFPDLDAAPTFEASLAFDAWDPADEFPNVLYHADVRAGSAEVESLGTLDESLVASMPATLLRTAPAHLVTPLPIGYGLYISWLQFDLDPGFESGHFTLWAQGLVPTGDASRPLADTAFQWSGTLNTVPVPEPGRFALFCLGAVALVFWYRRPLRRTAHR